jgi:hypothetical protein
MKSNKVKGFITGIFLVAMLIGPVGATTADAQTRRRGHRPPRIIVYRSYDPFWHWRYDPFWNPYYSRYSVVDPVAYQRERGFSEGKDEGKDDAKKGRPANATGHKDYLKSDSIHFREAFIQGYNAGYEEKIADIREKMREKGEE